MLLDAGELQFRGTLQKRVSKPNAYGEIQDVWTDLATHWGKLSTLTKGNVNLAKGFAATVNYDWKMRYNPAANNDCRLIVKGKTYEVDGVIHDPLRQWSQLFLTALED